MRVSPRANWGRWVCFVCIYVLVYPWGIFADDRVSESYRNLFPDCARVLENNRAAETRSATDMVPRLAISNIRDNRGPLLDERLPKKAFVTVRLLPPQKAKPTFSERGLFRTEFLLSHGWSNKPAKAKSFNEQKFSVDTGVPVIGSYADGSEPDGTWTVNFQYDYFEGRKEKHPNFPNTTPEPERLVAQKMYLQSPNGQSESIRKSDTALRDPGLYLIGVNTKSQAFVLNVAEFIKQFVADLDKMVLEAEKQAAKEREAAANVAAVPGEPDAPETSAEAAEVEEEQKDLTVGGVRAIRLKDGTTALYLRALLHDLAKNAEHEDPTEILIQQLRVIAEYFEKTEDPEEIVVAKLILKAIADSEQQKNTETWTNITLNYEITGKVVHQLRKDLKKHYTNPSKWRFGRSLKSFRNMMGYWGLIWRNAFKSLGNRERFHSERWARFWYGASAGLVALILGWMLMPWAKSQFDYYWHGIPIPAQSASEVPGAPLQFGPDPNTVIEGNSKKTVGLFHGEQFLRFFRDHRGNLVALDPSLEVFDQREIELVERPSGKRQRYRVEIVNEGDSDSVTLYLIRP